MGCAAEPSVADCLRALQLAAEEFRCFSDEFLDVKGNKVFVE